MKMRAYQPRETCRLNVIGVPGQGKSIFRYLFQRDIYRYVLWNPLEDYHVGEPISVDEFVDRKEEFRRGCLRITVAPSSYDPAVMYLEYDHLCYAVYDVGALHFGTEEIALVASPTIVPPALNELCIKGRHRAVSMSFYGQRFHQFPLIVRGTASEIIAFRQIDPKDVKDFEDRIKPSMSPVPLNELPDHHFVRWTPEQGAILHKPLMVPNGIPENGTGEVAQSDLQKETWEENKENEEEQEIGNNEVFL